MNDFFQFLGIGLGTAIGGVLAAKLAGAFRHAAPGAEEKLVQWTEKTSAWLHEKVGTGELSPETLAKIRQVYHDGISWTEAMVGSEDFWQAVLYILRGNAKLITSRLWALLTDWVAKGMPKEIPAELKTDLINPAKEEMALKPIRASLAMLVPPEQMPSDEEIRANIRTIAPAAGRTLIANPLNPPILKRPDEMQAEIERLRAKVEAKP